jgi:hypothetical protein
VQADALQSRSLLLCCVHNSAEVRISVCTRVVQAGLYFLSAAVFVYSCVVLCDSSMYFKGP